MKTVFIPAKFKSNVNESRILDISKSLPKEIAIAYSIQFQDIANEIKDILEKNGHVVIGFMQVLGCSKPKFHKDVKAVLLISTGRFHAVSLASEAEVPIYILDKNKLEKITKEDLGYLKQKQKASYLRFLNASNVGIIVSAKPGQNRLKKAIDFRKTLKKQQKLPKNPYLFLSDTINIKDLENFPTIQSWVNTACPRMDMDSSTIINIDKIPNSD